MKVLVTYHSDTGNTEKVAKAIYDGIEQRIQKDMARVDTVESADPYDLIFVGFPVIASTVHQKVEGFLKDIPAGKKVALFATHGSLRGGPLARTAFEYAATLPKGKIVGSFGCRGKVPEAVIDALMAKPEHKAWAEEAQSANTHPDETDLTEAGQWATDMVTKA